MDFEVLLTVILKATTGVLEAHLHYAEKRFFIRAIPSQTCGNIWTMSPLQQVCDGIAIIKQGF